MALIPLEGLGAPSQKTSLLGGVAQILINPRPSPRLADVGLFVRPKSQHLVLQNLFAYLHLFFLSKHIILSSAGLPIWPEGRYVGKYCLIYIVNYLTVFKFAFSLPQTSMYLI